MVKNPWWKILIKIIAIVLGLVILVVVTYVSYVSIQYSRIEDNKVITIENNMSNYVELNQDLSIATYNIGFGAYTHDFSFFMDEGKTLDGKTLKGKDSVAKDKKTVEKNINGVINELKKLNTDFAFLQEVDVKANRSYKFNQYQLIKENFKDYSSSIAMNFHTAYLLYPLFNSHGKTDAGIMTLSKYKIDSAIRRSLPVDTSFPTKFFDLDRCIQVNRLPVKNSDKELIIINVHLSAYDEGGKIRKQQIDMLNKILDTEYSKGNYVVAGGDFNHDIANSIGLWQTNREKPEWVYSMSNSSLAKGYKFVSSTNCATCRSTDGPYIKNENYLVVLDGFICSSNIKIKEIKNIDTDFKYSDHNPVKFIFELI